MPSWTLVTASRSHSWRPPLPAFALGYQKAWLGADALAAVALLVIAVPEQLATSRLAQMPPITGLYTFVAGSVLFALLGSNPQMSIGADSTIAPLFAAGIGHLAPGGSADYIALVGLMSVVVGLIVAAVGLLRLGWIAEFLSAPIITGFLAGIAVIIIVHQLPDLLGLPAASGSTIHRVTTIVQHLGSTNGWTLGIGVVVFALVAGAERIDRRLPGALAGLVGSTIVVGAAGLAAHHGVAVLGTVAHGAPQVGLHDITWSSLGSVLPIAAVVALVVVSQSAATSRAFADQGDYRVDLNRDFIGTGAGSIAAGLVGAFAVDASPVRTGAVAGAGGRTQVTSLLAAAVVVLVVPAAGLLKDLPDATLAGVLIYIAVRIFHVRDLRAVLRFDYWEFGLALVTLVTVALVGVEQGIAVAVGLAILDRTRLSSRPSAHLLVRIAGTTSWRPLEKGEEPVESVPGVLVVLFAAPLYFATATRFRNQVDAVIRSRPVPPKALVLDLAGVHDIDFTGARALRALLDERKRAQMTVVLARAGDTVRHNLERAGLLGQIGEDHFFETVDEAVQGVAPAP
jgi:sulfate permease, SulP family